MLLHRDGGPQWSLNRYAYGWTDKKPWGAVALMLVIFLIDTVWLWSMT